jgi:hypothetical protein
VFAGHIPDELACHKIDQSFRDGVPQMKYFALLCLCTYLIGCSATHLDPAAPNTNNSTSTSSAGSGSGSSASGSGSSSSNSGSAQSETYDMLQWMTMDPSLSAAHHMSGTANPIYTTVLPDRFYWTKSGQGFPWDVKLYDNNFIYLWATEWDWNNPSTYKVFRSPALGNYNMPMVARFAQGGYPGSTIKVSDSTYEIHTSCSHYTTKSLGYVITELWGPYNESLGGTLPNNLETLIISYRYSCDSTYSNCNHKEEFHVAKPYGLVKWQHQLLQSDGTYAPPDNVTYINKVVSGQTTVVTTCF